ncbi:hypothetical protein BD770DRAFT_302573, partial [Pilaira anomala]
TSKILNLDNNIEEEIEAENININQQNEQVEDDQEALDEEGMRNTFLFFFLKKLNFDLIFSVDTKNPSLFPSEPVAYIFVMLLLMMQGKYLTLEGCEVVMFFLNIVLTYLNLEFRFPKKLSTFITRMKFNENVYKGVKKYVACKSCHSIYEIPENNSDRSVHATCRFASRISSTSRLVLERCNTDLYTVSRSGKLNPTMTFVYNSIITTLRQFFSRKNFMKEINSWRKRKLQKEGYVFDVMDGDVWKSFKIDKTDNVPFVDASNSNLMLNFNLD